MRKTYGPLKAKICKLGVSCGGSCINREKSCKINVTPAQRKEIAKAATSALTKTFTPKQKSPEIIAVVKEKALAPKIVTAIKAKQKSPQVAAAAAISKISVAPTKPAQPPAGALLGQGAFGMVTQNADGSVTKSYGDYSSQNKIYREAKYQSIAASAGVAPRVLEVTNKIRMEKALGATVDSQNEKWSMKESRDYADARRAALIKLHKVGIAHNDFHTGNIFWDSATQKVTIIDYGLATKKPADLLWEYRVQIKEGKDPNFNTIAEYKKWLKTQ
jgi:predicted Ser/Thr protein kinase